MSRIQALKRMVIARFLFTTSVEPLSAFTWYQSVRLVSGVHNPLQRLKTLDIQGVAEYLKNEAKNVVFMCGAGISTSAGIPDFRSPGTGLYDNLEEYHLTDPMDIFNITYFKRHPEPFFTLSPKLFPACVKPTMAHYFIRFVDEKGKLRRCFTQNIDSLEYVANIDPEKLVTAHGSHHTSTCMNCRQVYDLDWITEKLAHKDWKILKCETCGGVVKPNIVFFGEALPVRFFDCCSSDLPVCDLLIIMGTSLVVHPFASMIYEVADDVPRLLINMTDAGKGGLYERAMGLPNLRYDEVGNYRDVFWRGSCDDGVALLADLMGWKHELNKLVQNEWNKLDIKFAKLKKRVSDQSRTTDFDSKSS